MPHKLYVYLSGGRGDAYVTDLWDGLPPEDEGMVDAEGNIVEEEEGEGKGKEVGRPYRDIFASSLEFNTAPLNIGTGGDNKLLSGRHPAHGAYYIEEVSPAAWSTGTNFVIGAAGLVAETVKVSHSDEMVHHAPRQHYQVHTWLVFKEAGGGGATFKFRKEQVIGWGKNARVE